MNHARTMRTTTANIARTIFWNVDTQYDFMRADGALYVPNAESIEKNLEKLTQYANKNDLLIVSTGDWHTSSSKEFSATPDYRTTFPPHCLAGCAGAEFVPATRPADAFRVDWRDTLHEEIIRGIADGIYWIEDKPVSSCREIVLYKDDFDVFKGNPHTEKILEIIKPDRAIVYGVATNVCVDYAVMGLLERGIAVTVVKDAIKELPGLPLEETIKKWEKKGAVFATTEQIVGGM